MADPPGGSGTGDGGDVFQVSYEVGDGTKHTTTTTSSTRITDNKPGWGAVLFGVLPADSPPVTGTGPVFRGRCSRPR